MPLTLTRQQLYERVWTTPIDTLSGELGLSGRGLGKLCARYDIPVPPRGHWAKKAAGKRVSKPPLPLPDTHTEKIRFNSPLSTANEEHSDSDVHPLVLFEGLEANRIVVSEVLPLSDPLVLKTQRLLARGKRDGQGMIVVPANALAIHTSRALHDRALRIMQTLITAFADREFAVANTSAGVRVTVLDEALGFGVEEGTKTVEHRTSYTEQMRIDRGLGYQVPKVDHVPAGTLTLVITNVTHVRQRWSEGTRPLEELLNKFLVGLVRAALGLKKQRVDAERRERERQEAERRRQQEARRQAQAALRWREEQGKTERLERLASVWRRNQELRQLVASVQAAVGDVEANSELGRWLIWAGDHVDTSDPLRHLRNRHGQSLTVYYHGWDHDRISERGFSEPPVTEYGSEKTKSGVELTCRPAQSTLYGSSALKLVLAEDLLLPFEWAQDSAWYWRVFRVPAAVLNRFLGYGQPDGHEDVAAVGDTEIDVDEE